MPVVIAIANHKGGVGKTTTAVTLAAVARQFGRRALLIDLDPQAQCAVALGIDRAPGLYQVLRENAALDRAVVPARPGLDLLPGTRSSTARLQDELVSDPWGHLALAEVLERQAGLYHLILMDCPPTLGRLNVAALMAAHLILVPTTCNYLGLESLGQYRAELDDARRRRGGPTAQIAAVIPTFYDGRTSASREALALLRADFPDLVAHPIPRATIAERIVENGRTLWELAPKSPVGIAYAWLAEWFYRAIRDYQGGRP